MMTAALGASGHFVAHADSVQVENAILSDFYKYMDK